MTTLRHYQSSAIEKLREKIRSGLKRVVLVAATGSGKTRIAAEIIMNAVKNGKRVAFVCNRIELVKQSVAAFEKLGIKCGIMQGENTWNANEQVVVCSVQTMVRRKFNMFDILIHDEVHVSAASKAYHKVIEQHSNCIHIGLTATPWSKGMAKLHKWLEHKPLWQDVVVAASIPLLIEQGFLVDVDIYAPSEPDLKGVKIVNGDYDKTQLGMAVDKAKLVGDIVHHWFKLAAGEQTVVFAVNVNHSKHIVSEFVANGVDARHIDGYMTEEERRPIIDAFRNGEFTILSNCSMLAEGFDVPATSCCVLARPTKSLIRYIQMVGRVLRPHEGKERALLLDHSGAVVRLGWPTDEIPYELDDGKPKESTKTEVLPRVCPSCFNVYKPSLRKCPVCSFEPKPVIKPHEVEEGELVQLSKKSKKYSNAEKQEIYSAFLGWAKLKGHKEGSAYHRYKEMVGCYPSNQLDKVVGPMIDSVQNFITHQNIKYSKSIFKKAA